ncbi:telomere repeats-binding bouquet formation protein 1 [Brachionichthys hirsutus]|uniref:telomere repeats-binding bouquet formation protein 1 n=1 Tax=Brachionichthys hirsutus TaxID=412623 RepID=UPI0036054638
MDKAVACSISRNTIQTDLSVLLECLKFQMKCPELQKQALLTIHSICERNEDAVDLLREMGGVAFLYNLSISSIVHSDIKETALFTLGTLAETSVYCKNSLCRKETFTQVAGWLMAEDIPLSRKRVSVYFLSVLVANNKSGQTLAQNTGCLDILLDLFRTTFPLSPEATSRAANATQTYQLWVSVSSALCGCVNNPQNEEGQRICVAVFPIMKTWLQQMTLPRIEIFTPICSFIAMTVGNNTCVQENFSASGALDTLTLALVQQASAAEKSSLSCQISIILSKTLSVCITDNPYLVSGLAHYGVVPYLFSLLRSPHLEPEDMLSVLLTLGHCSESSEKHQSQLIECGGLPLIITLLTEDTQEEVRNAAAFLLQTCKQAIMSLGLPGLISTQGKAKNMESPTDMESFRNSAAELLRRIEQLEKRQIEREDTDPSASTERACVEAGGGINTKLQSVRHMVTNTDENERSPLLGILKKKAELTGDVLCSMCKGAGALMSSQHPSLEGGREPHSDDNQLFKPPTAVRHSLANTNKSADEEGLQSHQMNKMGKIPAVERSPFRCAGCVLSFEEVTSRTFTSFLRSCHHSCDLHEVLLEATEGFRTRRCKVLFGSEYHGDAVVRTDPDSETVSDAKPQKGWKNWSEVSLTPINKGAGTSKSSQPDRRWKKHDGFTLTPMHRGNKTNSQFSERKADSERGGGNESGHDELNISTDHCSTRKKREDFSHEEASFLLKGVNAYGYSWNSILWSFPFKPGRTNVDLAKKYRQLMVRGESFPR